MSQYELPPIPSSDCELPIFSSPKQLFSDEDIFYRNVVQDGSSFSKRRKPTQSQPPQRRKRARRLPIRKKSLQILFFPVLPPILMIRLKQMTCSTTNRIYQHSSTLSLYRPFDERGVYILRYSSSTIAWPVLSVERSLKKSYATA